MLLPMLLLQLLQLQLQLLLLQPLPEGGKREGREAAGAIMSPGWRGGSSGESSKPFLESLPSHFC